LAQGTPQVVSNHVAAPDVDAIAQQAAAFKATVLSNVEQAESAVMNSGGVPDPAHKPRPTPEEMKRRIALMGNQEAVGTCCAYAFHGGFMNTDRYEVISLLECLLERPLDQRQSNAVHSSIASQYIYMRQYDKGIAYADSIIGQNPAPDMPLLVNFTMAKNHAYRGQLYDLIRHRSDYSPEQYRQLGCQIQQNMDANAALWFSITRSHRAREKAIYEDQYARDWARFQGLEEL